MEDELKKQFFRDHQLEAFRPTTLVDGREIEDEHLIRGKAWAGLRQGTRNPKPGEYAHTMIYLWATNIDLLSPQCRSFRCKPSSTPRDASQPRIRHFRCLIPVPPLRPEQEVLNAIAILEAKYYGADFGLTETERGSTMNLRPSRHGTSMRGTTRTLSPLGNGGGLLWNATSLPFLGRLVRSMSGSGEGIRPNYSPALAGLVSITLVGLSPSTSSDPDPMRVLQEA